MTLRVERVVRTGPPLLRYLEETRCCLVAFSGRSPIGEQILGATTIAGAAKDLLVI